MFGGVVADVRVPFQNFLYFLGMTWMAGMLRIVWICLLCFHIVPFFCICHMWRALKPPDDAARLCRQDVFKKIIFRALQNVMRKE